MTFIIFYGRIVYKYYDEDLIKYKNVYGEISTFFGVCEVNKLSEKLLVMPEDCSVLRIEDKSISNGMSILFSPCIQKFYLTPFSLRHSNVDGNIIDLTFCFSSSTDTNIVDNIVNIIKKQLLTIIELKKLI